MSNYADALRRKPPPSQSKGPTPSEQGQTGRNKQEEAPRNRENGPPTSRSQQQSKPPNAWGRRPPAASVTKRPVESTTSVKQKSKKPKPTLAKMSLGDLIPRGTVPSASKPKKQQQQIPTKIAPAPLKKEAPVKKEDFPALGTTSVPPKVTPVLPKQAKWGKPAATKKAPPPQKRVLLKASKPKAPILPTKKKAENKPSVDWKSFGAKPRSEGGDELDLIRLLQDGKFQSSQKKGRQRITPRKKKFTSLKKKILQERLKAWRELHPEEVPETKKASTLEGVSCTVCLRSFAHADELEDNEEYQEIVSDLKDMATKVGPIRDVYLCHKPTGECPAFVWFETSQSATEACACWNGLVIGGQEMDPILVNAGTAETTEGWRQAIASLNSAKDTTSSEDTAQICLRNVLTSEDFEDKESLEECISDIRKLVEDYGSVSSLEVKQEDGEHMIVVTYSEGSFVARNAMANLDGRPIGGTKISASPWVESSADGDECFVELKNVLTSDDFEDEDCMKESLEDVKTLAKQFGPVSDVRASNDAVLVYFSGGSSVARIAAEKLDGTLIGGNIVSAEVVSGDEKMSSESDTSWVVLQNILTEDDINDEECLEESIADLKELASQYGKVLNVTYAIEKDTGIVKIEYEGGRGVVESAASKFNGMVIGGQTVVASVVSPEGETMDAKPTAVATLPAPQEVAKPAEPAPLYSGDKLIPERFAECKRVPKLSSANGPRHYANVTGDATMKSLLNEMLGELMRLQKRAIEDKNAKARRRLVMGLREVARGIRAHKVKMVVMANNLDKYGAIDEKLQEILDLAREEDIPVCFELNKRHLGKAVGKTIKVSVVGVQSAEGAHQQFKKLTALTAKLSTS